MSVRFLNSEDIDDFVKFSLYQNITTVCQTVHVALPYWYCSGVTVVLSVKLKHDHCVYPKMNDSQESSVFAAKNS